MGAKNISSGYPRGQQNLHGGVSIFKNGHSPHVGNFLKKPILSLNKDKK